MGLLSRKSITELDENRGKEHAGAGRVHRRLVEGSLELIETRQDAAPPDPQAFGADELPPILFPVSDTGPQMTSVGTREFTAMCAIAQHFGRPRHPDRPGVGL
jgi:hypothetical protein